jgi:hypothetical protein
MASVPLSMNKLEEITFQVAQELLEQWAIDDRFNEDQVAEATQNAVNDTVFVINRFMEEFNTQMLVESEQKTSLVLPE